ncbi:hypothetical protein EPUL_005303, partial [Erysiphe pulchra]
KERSTNRALRSRGCILSLFDNAKVEGRPLHVSAPMLLETAFPDGRPPLRHRRTVHAHDARPRVHPQRHRPRQRLHNPPAERQTTPHDNRPHVLVAQFASSSVEDFTRASVLIEPWVDGVNLNCGCPQPWAIKEGIGCQLMEEPERVAELVRAAKAELAPLGKSVSVKIRIAKDLEKTKRWITAVQDAGVDYITIHGRLKAQRSSTPPNYEAVRILKEFASVPIVANGDAYTLKGVNEIATRTGVDGVMAARGMLENPAMFAGYDATSFL